MTSMLRGLNIGWRPSANCREQSSQPAKQRKSPLSTGGGLGPRKLTMPKVMRVMTACIGPHAVFICQPCQKLSRDQTSTWTDAEIRLPLGHTPSFRPAGSASEGSQNDIDVEGLEILDGAQVQICREAIVTASQTKGKAPFHQLPARTRRGRRLSRVLRWS